MNNDLLDAVKERIQLGYSDDKIKKELTAAGYDKLVIPEVIDAARRDITHELDSKSANSSAFENTTLVSGSSLVKASFKFAWERYDLVLLLAIPFLTISVFSYVANQFALDNTVQGSIITVLSLLLGIAYFFIFLSTLYITAFGSQWDVTFKEGLTWSKNNFWSFIYINVLTFFVVMGGLFLFIIPGLIVSLYLNLSKLVLVRESQTGLKALLRSRELIKGYWWQVFWRYFVLSLAFFCLFLGAIMIIGFVSTILDLSIHSSVFELITTLLVNFLSAAITLMGIFVSVRIYEQLASIKPAMSEKTLAVKWKYLTLAIFGLIFFPAVIIISALLMPPGSIDDPSILDTKNRAIELREG